MFLNKKEKINIILEFLNIKYKDAKCCLVYKKPYELLIAARLSAQCTDKKVNEVTKKLFLKYKTLESFSTAFVEDIRKIIYPCGLFNKKALDVIGICRTLLKKFNSIVPNNMKQLLSLPGIGRKTANLILGEIYKKPTIVVDTHLIRISNRLGLVETKNPIEIEKQLEKLIVEEERFSFCHKIIFFGREICKAKKPICKSCELKKICNLGGF